MLHQKMAEHILNFHMTFAIGLKSLMAMKSVLPSVKDKKSVDRALI